MTELTNAIAYGILGGVARLLINLIKNYQLKEKIDFRKFGFYIILILAFGAFCGIVFGFAKQLSFLGGYSGLDLIDGYYKHFRRKKFKVKLNLSNY